MVISSVSIDPECLNLTQRYPVIYMVPILSFVSTTSKDFGISNYFLTKKVPIFMLLV